MVPWHDVLLQDTPLVVSCGKMNQIVRMHDPIIFILVIFFYLDLDIIVSCMFLNSAWQCFCRRRKQPKQAPTLAEM